MEKTSENEVQESRTQKRKIQGGETTERSPEKTQNRKWIEEMKPTSRFAKIFSFLFLIVVIIGLFNMPFASLFSGNENAKIKIGIPWAFFNLSIMNPESMPFNLLGLLGDILFLFFVAYCIDISIKVIIRFVLTKESNEDDEDE